jgi:hypothetical protein
LDACDPLDPHDSTRHDTSDLSIHSCFTAADVLYRLSRTNVPPTPTPALQASTTRIEHRGRAVAPPKVLPRSCRCCRSKPRVRHRAVRHQPAALLHDSPRRNGLVPRPEPTATDPARRQRKRLLTPPPPPKATVAMPWCQAAGGACSREPVLLPGPCGSASRALQRLWPLRAARRPCWCTPGRRRPAARWRRRRRRPWTSPTRCHPDHSRCHGQTWHSTALWPQPPATPGPPPAQPAAAPLPLAPALSGAAAARAVTGVCVLSQSATNRLLLHARLLPARPRPAASRPPAGSSHARLI